MNAVHGSFFCRPTALTSTPSRWPSPSSRHICDGSAPELSMHSGKQSVKSATYTTQTNAGTTSKPPDMGAIKCKKLQITLDNLPAERRPSGLREVPDEEINPDRM